LPTFVLGGGSNLVVSDEGFDGLVATVDEFGIDITEDHRSHRVRVGAGVVWDELVAFTVDERLTGLECLSGIPGRVGAAPIQNIGAYGAEAADRIIGLSAIDLVTGDRRYFDHADCGFGYRTSMFKSGARDRYLVTSVDFRLSRSAPSQLNYEELRKAFGGRESERPCSASGPASRWSTTPKTPTIAAQAPSL
jgi:UDP-N-acetylmuramate dehydrogenase